MNTELKEFIELLQKYVGYNHPVINSGKGLMIFCKDNKHIEKVYKSLKTFQTTYKSYNIMYEGIILESENVAYTKAIRITFLSKIIEKIVEQKVLINNQPF